MKSTFSKIRQIIIGILAVTLCVGSVTFYESQWVYGAVDLETLFGPSGGTGTPEGSFNSYMISSDKTIDLTENITLDQCVTVKSGVKVTINLNGHTIDRNLTGGTVDAGGMVFLVRGELTINGAGTIKGGNNSGVLVYGDAILNLNNVTITGNSGDKGGGVTTKDYIEGEINITGGSISGNSAQKGGGIYTKGTLTITDADISNNIASDLGGGVFNGYGTNTITNTSITGNTAANGGGGIWKDDGNVYLKNGTSITGNSSFTDIQGGVGSDWVGNIYISGAVTIINNTANGKISNYSIEAENGIDRTKIDGVLSGSNIGINLVMNNQVLKSTGAFTTNFGTSGNTDASCFFLDEGYEDTNYSIYINSQGEAAIGHVHAWNITGEGTDLLTLACTHTNASNRCSYDSTNPITIQVSAAGKDYDGNPVRATCTIMHGSFSVSAELLKNITQYEISDIKYMKTSASGVTTGGEALSAAPSISGHYYAKVELKVDAGTTKTVVKAFDITGNRVAIPVAATGLTYNGTSQVGVASGNYILTGTPEAVNAGNYSVTAKLSDVSSCMWSDGTITDKVFSYSIAPKDITVTITANGGTYGGTITPATATLHGIVGTDTVPVTLTYTGRANDGTSYNSQTPPTLAGTYTVSASISDTNYNLTGTKTAAFVVQKKKIDVPTAATGLIYNGTQQVGVATGVYDLLGNPNAVSAGGYTATAKLRNTENYMWSDGTITDKALSYSIAPKDITVTITANGGTYGGTITPATATLHGIVGTDTVPVTLTYTGRAHDGTSYNSQTPPTLAGTYTVSASISDTNYNLTGTKTDNYIVANGETSKPQELPKEESKPQNPEPVNEGKVEVNEGEDDDDEASEDVSTVPNTSDATPVKGYGILLMVSVTGMILACKDSRISKKGR